MAVCLDLRHRRKALETTHELEGHLQDLVGSRSETPPKGTGDDNPGNSVTNRRSRLDLRHRRKALETESVPKELNNLIVLSRSETPPKGTGDWPLSN